MLTVRHETIHGQTIIFQAGTVIRSHALPVPVDNDSKTKPPKSEGYVEFITGTDPVSEPAQWGTVYVMNDAGKTVAVHQLGGWLETPQGEFE